MEKLSIGEETSTDYFENVYEASKMLIQSFMSLFGYHPYSHEAIIAYGIGHLDVEAMKAHKLNKFRKMRNDILYRGDIATVKEAQEIRDLFQSLLSRLEPEFKNKV